MSKSQLSKELRKLRIDHDLTRGRMADIIGVKEGELASIEQGTVSIKPETSAVLIEVFAPEPDDNLDYESTEYMAARALRRTLEEAVIISMAELVFDMTVMTYHEKTRVMSVAKEVAERIKDEAEEQKKAKAAAKAKRAEERRESNAEEAAKYMELIAA